MMGGFISEPTSSVGCNFHEEFGGDFMQDVRMRQDRFTRRVMPPDEEQVSEVKRMLHRHRGDPDVFAREGDSGCVYNIEGGLAGSQGPTGPSGPEGPPVRNVATYNNAAMIRR